MKTAQVRLGHPDARLTLDLYVQATSAADRTAADDVDVASPKCSALALRAMGEPKREERIARSRR